jgi:site-specific recombinase XerD
VLADALKEHRVAMMAACHPGMKNNWVFPTEAGGMRLPQSAGKVFDLAREHSKIDQRITPQVLRRTFNSLLVKGGVDRIIIRSIVGHNDDRMTALYTGVDLADKQAAVVSIFSGKKGG